MVSRKQFITSNAMSAKTSGASKFADTSRTSESPESSIPKTDNKIGINLRDFIAETGEFSGEMLGRVLAFNQGGISWNGSVFGAADGVEFVPWRPEVEDVGSIELRVPPPYLFGVVGIGLLVKHANVHVVSRGQVKELRVVEHAKKLDASRAYEGALELVFVFTKGFA